jgi:hypothetical protein
LYRRSAAEERGLKQLVVNILTRDQADAPGSAAKHVSKPAGRREVAPSRAPGALADTGQSNGPVEPGSTSHTVQLSCTTQARLVLISTTRFLNTVARALVRPLQRETDRV